MSVGKDIDEEPSDEETQLFTVYDVNTVTRSEISIDLKIENVVCSMQLDTGCALSLAPLSFVRKICPKIDMKPTNVVLSTFTGETVCPLGEAFVKVDYSGIQKTLPLIVVKEVKDCGKRLWPNFCR